MTEAILKTYFDRYSKALFNFSIMILENSQEAEDVVQECFTALFYTKIEGTFDIRPWLFAIAKNKSLNIIKRRKRARLHVDYTYYMSDEESSETERRIIAADLYRLVNEEVEKLFPVSRQVFKMFYYDNMTIEDIAEKLNVPLQIVRNRKAFAIRALKLKLGEEGVNAAPKRFELSDRVKKKIYQEVCAGVSRIRISLKYHTSENTIYRIIKKFSNPDPT